jgi:hypothetical protein
MPRFVRRLALVLAAVLAAAACGSDSGVESSDPGQSADIEVARIATAVDEVTEAATGRFEMTIAYEGVPGLDGAELTGEGAYDLDNGATRLTMDLGALAAQAPGGGELPDGFGGGFETITVGTTVYMGGELFGAIPGLDAEWVKVDLSDAAGLEDLGLDSLTQGQGDPTATLEQLRSLGSIEEVGTEDVRGVATTHYAGEIRLGDTFDELDEAQRNAVAGLYGGDLEAVADLTIPIEVWVDDEGFVRRISQQIDFGQMAPLLEDQGSDDVGDLDGASLTTTVEYYDIGDDITVEAPQGAVDLTELLGSSFGS